MKFFDFSKIYRNVDLIITLSVSRSSIKSDTSQWYHFACHGNRLRGLSSLEAKIDIGSTWLELAAITTTRFREEEGKKPEGRKGEKARDYFTSIHRETNCSDARMQRGGRNCNFINSSGGCRFRWCVATASFCSLLTTFHLPSVLFSPSISAPYLFPSSLLPSSYSFSLYLCSSLYFNLSLSFTLYFVSRPIHLTFSSPRKGQAW